MIYVLLACGWLVLTVLAWCLVRVGQTPEDR